MNASSLSHANLLKAIDLLGTDALIREHEQSETA